MRRGGPGGRGKDEAEERLPRDFLVYKNGDKDSRPVNFTFVPSQHRTWDSLLEGIERVCPPIDKDDRIEFLYTPKGRKKSRIRDLDHLEGTITDQLVACGGDGFIEIPGGYERLKDLPPSDLSGSDTDDSEYENKHGRKKPSGKSRMDGNAGGRGNKGKDRFIFLFQNGKGYRASPKVFYSHQLVKGMDFILDELTRHNSNRQVDMVCTMDGKEVAHIDDLKEAGAYVIVYKGQKFDDKATYYIPDGAKDTSYQSDSDDSPRGKSRSPSPKRRSKSPKRNSKSPQRRSKGKSSRSNSKSKRR